MKIIFKNNTKYTKQVYFDFLEFHNKKFGKKYWFYTILVLIIILYILIINIIYFNWRLAILLIITCISFAIYRVKSQEKIIKNELKREPITQEKEFKFIFYEKYFKIRDKLKKETIKYYKIKKVYETEKYFYLYIDKTHSFLLSKDGFSIGNVKDFYKFIKKKKFMF